MTIRTLIEQLIDDAEQSVREAEAHARHFEQLADDAAAPFLHTEVPPFRSSHEC